VILTLIRAHESAVRAELHHNNKFGITENFGIKDFLVADRHFHVKKSNNPSAHLARLRYAYSCMLTAIGYIPKGVILAVDEPPQIATSALMFTFMDGYNDPTGKWRGIPRSSIYLCPAARTLGDDSFVYAMIHELAHFANKGVDDHAYFHKQRHVYEHLSTELAFGNADCYAHFAFEAIGKSNFNIRMGMPEIQ